MRYNKSAIMRDAWNRYKSVNAEYVSFGFCLHLAWVAAKEENKMDKLPALTGSEKQIMWAEKIRAAHIAWVERNNAHFEKLAGKAAAKGKIDHVEKYKARINKNNNALAWLISHATRAGWWLDNSDRYSLNNPERPNFNCWDWLVSELANNPEMKTFRFTPPWIHRMK